MFERLKIFVRDLIGRNELDVLAKFLYNSANFEYVPAIYSDCLGKGITISINPDCEYIRENERWRIPRVVNATRHSIESVVGFRVHLTDSDAYRGNLGVSPEIRKMYEMAEGKKVGIGILSLDWSEENLGPLSLRMYRQYARTVLGSKQVQEAKEDVIESAKIKLKVVTPKPLQPPEHLTPKKVEESLKPQKVPVYIG